MPNLYPFETIQKFGKNKEGTDYVVGDLHGMYDLLMKSLKKMKFNFEKDRLFCVGDLVDRGKNPLKLLALIDEPWFFSVMGNHDIQYLFQSQESKKIDRYAITYKIEDWWKELSIEDKRYVFKQIKKLPIAIQVKTNKGKVGITHASIRPNDSWTDTKTYLERHKSSGVFLRTYFWGRKYAKLAYLKNKKVKNEKKFIVDDVFCLYHGHTLNAQDKYNIYSLANRYYIDTGGCLGDYNKEGIDLKFKNKSIKPTLSFVKIEEPGKVYFSTKKFLS